MKPVAQRSLPETEVLTKNYGCRTRIVLEQAENSYWTSNEMSVEVPPVIAWYMPVVFPRFSECLLNQSGHVESRNAAPSHDHNPMSAMSSPISTSVNSLSTKDCQYQVENQTACTSNSSACGMPSENSSVFRKSKGILTDSPCLRDSSNTCKLSESLSC